MTLKTVAPFDIAGAKARLAAGNGGYEVVHSSPGLEIGVYVLVAPEPDRQQPHEVDEVYVVLEGSGWLEIGDQRVELLPGRWLRIDAHEHRQLHAGPDGIRMLAAGSTPGAPYRPNEGL